jgi:hypothetical protein
MLSDRHCRLLTALLDGQLSPRQHEAAQRLLARSEEARTLLRQLQEDARALGSLPPQALPADFSAQVMRVAAERGLRPGGGPRPLPRPAGVPAWVGLSVAAAVLLAVTAASFAYFRSEQQPEAFAVGPPNVPVPDKRLAPKDERLPLHALAQGPVRTRLEKEFSKTRSLYLDMTSANPVRSVERLREAFRRRGVHLHIDQRAQASLKKKQPKMTYVIYAEDIRPDELTAILQQVGRTDKGAPAADDSMLLNPLSDEDRTHLARLLGVPADRLQPPNLPMIPLHDPPILAPKGQQGKDGKNTRPASKEPGGSAVVLAFDGAANPGAIRQFLNRRRPHRPGAVQVYFVLRETSV